MRATAASHQRAIGLLKERPAMAGNARAMSIGRLLALGKLPVDVGPNGHGPSDLGRHGMCPAAPQRSREDEFRDALRVRDRQLLRNGAAQGVAYDLRPLDAHMVEKGDRIPGQRVNGIRLAQISRPADPPLS